MATFHAGEIILITAETKINGAFASPTTTKVSITKDSEAGTQILAPTDMTEDSTGHFSYGWVSSSTPATYYAKLHGTKTAPGNWEYKVITLI